MSPSRVRLRCALAALLVAPLIAVAGPASADTTPTTPTAPQGGEHTGKFHTPSSPRFSPRAVDPGYCVAGRYRSCDRQTIQYDDHVIVNGKDSLVGSYFITVETTLSFNAKSNQASGVTKIGPITATGVPTPDKNAKIDITSRGQTVGTFVFAMRPIGTQEPAGYGYSWLPPLSTIPTDVQDLTLFASDPAGGATEPGVFPTSAKVRCDNTALKGSVGCVNPTFPLKIDMSSLTYISANIKRLIAAGAPSVLHREQNTTVADAHRAAICGGHPPASAPPSIVAKFSPDVPSCDEYPFAGSKEGGVSPPGGWEWVPYQEEQTKQGGKIGSYVTNTRMMDGEAYQVVP